VVTGGTTSGLDEPVEVTRLREQADAVRSLLTREARDHAGDDLRRLVGLQELVTELRRMAPLAQSQVWVMQPRYFYDPEDPGVALARRARLRGVETSLLTRPVTLRTHPLLSSIYPSTRLGPVFLRAMVVDEAQLLVEGPDTADGERSSWSTSRPAVVRAVIDHWHASLALAEPILPPGAEPPLTERQLEVCRLLAVGEKDQVIARTLGTSARTVERDVRSILSELGASSRTEAVLLMGGRGVNGGWPEANPF
jgi:DNA-binding CsgD family transcriptional regulator